MESSEKCFAVVTGVSSGIGYELARVFAKDGVACFPNLFFRLESADQFAETIR